MLFQPSLHLNILSEENYFSEIENVEKELSLYETKGYFSSFDKAEIYYEYYLCQGAKASIVLVHGYTEFSKKYHELVWYLINMGYNVFLYDQRCHGLSHRYSSDLELTHIESYQDYSNDLSEYIDQIVIPQSTGCDIYLYSHSMGGAVSLLYLSQTNNKIKKSLLSAPMIYPTSARGPRSLLLKLLEKESEKYGWQGVFKFSRRFNPDVKFEESSMDSSKNRFIYNLNTRKNNPRYQNSTSTNRWNYETLSVKDIILSKNTIDKLNVEMLIVSGDKDDVVRSTPQKKLAKMAKCDYVTIKNAKHSLCTLKNDDLEKYLRIVFAFFDK